MGFLDALLGRTKPVAPNLDALFALPGASMTLQAACDINPTGTGSVCFRAAEGKAFSDIEKDVRDLRQAEPLHAFYFTPALSGHRGQTSLSNIFSTHPSLEKRLAQLDKISKQLSS